MWARAQGATENALLQCPFAAYMLRPGYIEPLHGIRSKAGWYRAMYALVKPLYLVLRVVLRKYMTTTEELGRAVLCAAKRGDEKRVVESSEMAGMVERSGGENRAFLVTRGAISVERVNCFEVLSLWLPVRWYACLRKNPSSIITVLSLCVSA